MPKMKTNKAVAARVKVTGRGKLRKRRPLTSHLKSRKSPKRLRKLRGEKELTGGFAKRARKMMGL